MQSKQLRKEIKKDVKQMYLKNYILVLIVTLFLAGAFLVIEETPGLLTVLKWALLFFIFAPLFFIGSIRFLSNLYLKKHDLNDLMWAFASKKRYFNSLIFLAILLLLVLMAYSFCMLVTFSFNYLSELQIISTQLSMLCTIMINIGLVIYFYLSFSPFPFFFVIENNEPLQALKNGYQKMKGKRVDYLIFNFSFIGWIIVVIIIMLMFASLMGITFWFKTNFLYMFSVTLFSYVSKIAVASFVYYYATCLTGYFLNYLEK